MTKTLRISLQEKQNNAFLFGALDDSINSHISKHCRTWEVVSMDAVPNATKCLDLRQNNQATGNPNVYVVIYFIFRFFIDHSDEPSTMQLTFICEMEHDIILCDIFFSVSNATFNYIKKFCISSFLQRLNSFVESSSSQFYLLAQVFCYFTFSKNRFNRITVPG